MESSGNNRYELLFMDDEGGAPTPAEAAQAQAKKKQTSTAAAPVKKAQTASTAANKKPNPNPEKENKAGTLNKNETAGKSQSQRGNVGGPGQVTKGKQNQVNGGANPTGIVKKRPTDGFRPPQSGGGGANVGAGSGGGTGSATGSGAPNEQRNNRRNFREGGGEFGSNNNNNNDQQRPPRQYNQRERENRGPPRNRFGENGYSKREFDRQSGSDKTGVKAVDKRDGAGAHNWGSVKEEIDDVNKSTNEGDTTLTDKEESSNEQTGEQVAAPEEDETKEMTLDEWKALQQQRNKPQYNLRKAGEGEDTSQWKKMTVLSKKKEGDSEEELEYDPSLYPQRVGRLQRIVDIQFNFNDSRRGGGSGFGRGRGRGGGRPGGGRFNDAGGRFNDAGGNVGGGRGGGGGGSSSGGGGGGGSGPIAGGAAPGENKYIPSGKPRNFGDKQRGGGPNSLKVDDERQFPTLS